MHKVSIIIPVYNEYQTIEGFITKVQKLTEKNPSLCEYIIVDDYSTDGTTDTLKRLSKLKNIYLVTHGQNLGYGAALKTGITRAAGDVICIIDADNTYSPESIPELLPFIDRFDMVVGSRELSFSAFALTQKIAKSFMHLCLGIVFKQKIADINSGLRLIKKDILKRYLSFLPNSFSFTSSLTLIALLQRYKIKYVPVSYAKRTGQSKIRPFVFTINFIKSYWKISRLYLANRLR